MKSLQQQVPFCIFEANPVAAEDQVNEKIKGLTE